MPVNAAKAGPRVDVVIPGVTKEGEQWLNAISPYLQRGGPIPIALIQDRAIIKGPPLHKDLLMPGSISSLRPGEKAELQNDRTMRKVRRNGRLLTYVALGLLGGAATAALIAVFYYNRRLLPPPNMGGYYGYGYL